ncbi:MAG TPA: hypothetical protein PL001_01295, partial [Candidatus Kryptobacter bacterium]|nr:hypothetical protein [Candidatus Kryptobacter bacterium]
IFGFQFGIVRVPTNLPGKRDSFILSRVSSSVIPYAFTHAVFSTHPAYDFPIKMKTAVCFNAIAIYSTPHPSTYDLFCP